jgi:ribA/ribD-fused uncharacterized protein
MQLTRQEKKKLKQEARKARLIAAGMPEVVVPEKVYFYSVDGYLGVFSNFSRNKITVDGQVYKTSEHYYQSEKYRAINETRRKEVIDTFNPKDAAYMSRDEKFPIREDWESVKDAVMLTGLRAKFGDRDWLTYTLVRTDKAELLEDTTNDYYWGIGTDGTGQNKLGRMLMQVRKELNAAGITVENCETLLVAPKPGQKEEEEKKFAQEFKEAAARRKEVTDPNYKNPVEKLESAAKNPLKAVVALYPKHFTAGYVPAYQKAANYGRVAPPAPAGGLPPKPLAPTGQLAGLIAGPALGGKPYQEATLDEQKAAYQQVFGPPPAADQPWPVSPTYADPWDNGEWGDAGDEEEEGLGLTVPEEGQTWDDDGFFMHTFISMEPADAPEELYVLSGGGDGQAVIAYFDPHGDQLLDEIEPEYFLRQNPLYAEQLVTALKHYARWLAEQTS